CVLGLSERGRTVTKLSQGHEPPVQPVPVVRSDRWAAVGRDRGRGQLDTNAVAGTVPAVQAIGIACRRVDWRAAATGYRGRRHVAKTEALARIGAYDVSRHGPVRGCYGARLAEPILRLHQRIGVGSGGGRGVAVEISAGP